MKQSKLSGEEILAAEKAKDDRKQSRGRGFAKMDERDSGGAVLRDYNAGGPVLIYWHVPPERREDGVAYQHVPEGMFSLKVDNKIIAFDAEEFRRWLRWV